MSFRRALAGMLHTVACRHDPRARLLPHLTILRSSYVACNEASIPHSGEGQPVVSGSAPKEVHGGFSMDDSSKSQGLTSPLEGEKQVSFSLSDSDKKMEFPGAPAQDRVRVDEKEYPRPAEIPWQEKVANSVNLIGRVGLPVHLETFPDGSAYAIAILEQKKTPNFPQLWIPVIFQGDLAGIAACHLKEDDRIHISGQLSADSPQIVMEDRVSTLHVMAQSLSFIQEKPEGGKTEPLHKRLPHATHLAEKSSIRGLKISESHWDDFLTNPHNWWDTRHDKVNPRRPDFVHKEYNLVLWLGQSTPSQVLLSLKDSAFCQKLEQLDTDKQTGSIFGNKLWEDLLSNPGNWIDGRNSKTKTNQPDFKHRISGRALWIGETTPPSVTLALDSPDFCEKLIKWKTGKS
ncbi:protein OSB4, chloroplastic-like isoform X2 [Nymphaea colorata]|uniref:protein OSB4, chloroplastic-like isoform X2 n=1 Tax=Nymphaea colorata TaxID=210225 RepID=UPI00129D5073|nr:protein OSB4, chloroplastic-like isoform X2 [Nymphaea colorata]